MCPGAVLKQVGFAVLAVLKILPYLGIDDSARFLYLDAPLTGA